MAGGTEGEVTKNEYEDEMTKEEWKAEEKELKEKEKQLEERKEARLKQVEELQKALTAFTTQPGNDFVTLGVGT